MAIAQESVFSIIYHLKHDPGEYWIEDWALHGPMLLRWLGSSLVNIFTFQWTGWLIHLPIVRPEALASLFHEYTLPSSIETTPTPFRGLLTISETVPTTASTNQFLLGVMNSPALVISVSATTIFCIRWLAIGLRWGAMLAFFMNFLANWLVVVAVLFGLDEIISRWYFLTPLTYIASISFMWRMLFHWWINAPTTFEQKQPGPFGIHQDLSIGLKMGMTGFVLGLSEQIVLFQKLAQPLSPAQLNLLHGFTTGSLRDHILMHASYVTGLFVGGLLLGTAILLFMVIPAVDYGVDKKMITPRGLLITIIIFTSGSVPYYGFDYLLTRLADFGPDSGWEENTPFTRTLPSLTVEGATKITPKRDDARPWLEINMLAPERKWLKKVRKVKNQPLFSFRMYNDATSILGKKLMKESREKWVNRFEGISVGTPYYNKVMWDFLSPHFYQWKEEEVSRQSFQRFVKGVVDFSRYRMIRLQTIHLKALTMTEDGKLTHKVVNTFVPYIPSLESPDLLIKKLAKRPFTPDYFHWILMPNEAELKKAAAAAEKLQNETPEQAKQRKMEEAEANRAKYKAESQQQAESSKQAKSQQSVESRELTELKQSQKSRALVGSPRLDILEEDDDQQEVIPDFGPKLTKKQRKGFVQPLIGIANTSVWINEEEEQKALEEDIENLFGAVDDEKRERRTRDTLRVQEGSDQGWPYMHAKLWKSRAYSHFMYRRLLELDIDGLIARQPARNFVTDAEHKRLKYHQIALSAYHRGLRKYDESIYSILLEPRSNFKMAANPLWRWDSDWKVGYRAKSLENYVYDQRFKGSHRVVERLFFLDTDWNPWAGPLFAYDQLLPLEEKDKGDRSNIWHEEIPREVREKVGAYDSFQSQRVTPMFDPVPFYIGWDPMVRKSVLTTSRLPKGTARVKLVLPATPVKSEFWNQFDFLGIKRFLEETKLYEHLDFVADKDHEFSVYVKHPLNEEDYDYIEEGKKEQEKTGVQREIRPERELHQHEPPSNYRLDPRLELVMPGWNFSKEPAEPFDVEFENTIREKVTERAELLKEKEEAEKKKASSEQIPTSELQKNIEIPELSDNMIRRIRKNFARKYQIEQLAREFERSKKPLVSERNPREFLSPKTWLKTKNQIDSLSELDNQDNKDLAITSSSEDDEDFVDTSSSKDNVVQDDSDDDDDDE